MPSRPLRVYLDSSDYSVLSNPQRSNDAHTNARERLKSWANQGAIQCVFSGVHLSEMAPLDPQFSDASQRRADLLVDLCGRNVLISQDRLFLGELRFATGEAAGLPDVYSSTGDWFPDGVADLSPISHIEMATQIRNVILESGLNREARRKAERRAFKRGKPRAVLQKYVVDGARTGMLDEILAKYPMRPQDARTIGRYAVGDASPEEATQAFIESLRDPRWMMQWFSMHHGQLTPFIEWTRGPAVTAQENMNQMYEHALLLRRGDAAFGTNHAASTFSSAQWAEWQDALLVRIANRLSAGNSAVAPSNLTSSTIDSHCPGLSVAIRSLHSAWWTATIETPRAAKLSDFPDALHAMYSPYVDIFRADSFMAPHIEKWARRHGTLVVPKLSGLVAAIESTLGKVP